ncbi:hypothetical protein JXL19_06245 [bacterium]|nr:hypothetical protein [bacterium]
MISKGSAWRKAEQYGFDMSIIRNNLGLSPHERVVEHQKALEFYLTLKAAGKRYYARLGKDLKDLDRE